jgi:hypothetical protein
LNYIDSASLRQNVQRAVNCGESYHQLRRTISYANYGKLRFGTEYEQHLWSECRRLIANCIIFYNATLLNRFPLSHGNTSIYTDATNSVNGQSLWMWTKIVRELAEIRIGTEPALAA